MEDAGSAGPGSATRPYQVATPVSRTSSSASQRTNHASNNTTGNDVGGPLRSNSESSSFYRYRTTAHRRSDSAAASLGNGIGTGTGTTNTGSAGRTTSPSYRHNPYLASPTSETYLYLASPESIGLEGQERRRSVRSSSNNASAADDAMSDRRLVVRSRSSRRGVSSPARSVSEGGLQPPSHHSTSSTSRCRARNLSPAYMNPLEDQLMAASKTLRYNPASPQQADPQPQQQQQHQQQHANGYDGYPVHARRDSTASLSCDNSSYSAVLYSCTDSSSASHHISPSMGQITSLIHAPASPLASAPYARRGRTESPSTSRHSTMNTSNSHGSPETSSLYYSFGNHSANTVASTSNNPYVGVRITPETTTGGVTAAALMAVNQDGVSPYTASLGQRSATIPRVNNNYNNGGVASLGIGGGQDGTAYGVHRTPLADNNLPARMARVYAASSTPSTTPQNSPGAVILNANESILSIPSTFVTPTAASAAAAAAHTTHYNNNHHNNTSTAGAGHGAVRMTATPRSQRSDTPPPYNQPSSAPLSPDTAGMIVPPGHPAAVALHHHHHYHHGAVRSEVSTSSQNSSVHRHPHHYTPLQGQLQPPHSQTQQRHVGVGTPPPPFMPPSRAATQQGYAATAANAHHDHLHQASTQDSSTYNPNGAGIQFLHSMDSDVPLPTTQHEESIPATTTVNAATVLPVSPSAEGVSSRATTPDQTDILSDRASPTQFRTLTAAGRTSSHPNLHHSHSHHPHHDHNSGSGSTASHEAGHDDGATTAATAAAATTGEVEDAGRPYKKSKQHSGTTTAAPGAESNLVNSLTSANGMTRTAAGLPEMLSNGPTSMELGRAEEDVTAATAIGAVAYNDARKRALPHQQQQQQQAEEASEEDEDDDDEGGAAQGGGAGPAGADGKKAKNKKKKRARRNRKLKFLEDLPPAIEMKFLPPPPPPLPAPYGDPSTTAGTTTKIDFDKYYGVLVRWYERILADEADFVGLNYPPVGGLNSTSSIQNVGGQSATSLEASHATLHNSGMLQNSGNFPGCTPAAATLSGSTPGTTPSSAVFALTNFNQQQQQQQQQASAVAAVTSATTRVRRNAGGGEVPVLCPRIEQYLPPTDIPAALKSAGMVAAASMTVPTMSGLTSEEEDRRYSLLSGTANAETAAAAATANVEAGEKEKAENGGAAAAPDAVRQTPLSKQLLEPQPQLRVRHVERAVQWAKDLNSWWLCYVHPHSFNSRRQHIPQGFPLPATASSNNGLKSPTITAAGMPAGLAPPQLQQQQQQQQQQHYLQQQQQVGSSNMGSMYNWPQSSMVMTGYEGSAQAFPSTTAMGSGSVGMSMLSGGNVSVAATAAPPEHAYAGLPMPTYPPYAIPGMMSPPSHMHPHHSQQPQPQQHQQQQPMMGIYTVYH